MEKTFEKFNPDRRDFVKKLVLHSAYIIPAVVSVSMVDQKLDLSTAHAVSGNITSP